MVQGRRQGMRSLAPQLQTGRGERGREIHKRQRREGEALLRRQSAEEVSKLGPEAKKGWAREGWRNPVQVEEGRGGGVRAMVPS